MALPYDGARMISDPPLKNGRLRKGIIPANPALDPNSETKASWLRTVMGISGSDQTPGDWFPGVTSMNYNPTLYDDSEPGLSAYVVDRSTGSSYPDGSSWKIPEDARGISESGNNTTGVAGDDAHCVIVNWTDRRVLTTRQFHGLDFHGGKIGCYSASVSPMDGEAAGWMVSPSNIALSGVGAPGSGSNGSPGTGSGISMFDGLVIPEEFEYFQDTGQVLGGLRCTLNVSRISTGTVFPAWKTDGEQTPSAQTMKEGQMFYLAATPAQIASITDQNGSKTTVAAAWGRFIATKMTRGVRVEDRTGGNFGLFAVHRKTWENLGLANRWQAVLGVATPTLLLRNVRGFPQDIRVLAEGFVPDMDGGGGGGPNQAPRASFTISPTNPAVNQTVTFTDTSYDPDGSIVSRAWALDNDGLYNDGGANPTTKSYPTSGVKNVALRVTDDDGSTDTVGASFTVSASPAPNQPPLASFNVSPVSPLAGQLTTLTSTSSDPDGSIASTEWDLDNDGSFDDGTGASVQTSWPAAGTYTVRMRVTDNGGSSTTAERQVVVRAVSAPTDPLNPTSVVAAFDEINAQVVVAIDLPRDDARDGGFQLRNRAGARSGTTPGASPSSTIVFAESSPGAGSGNTEESGSYFALRPGVDEIKLVRVQVPAAGPFDLWAFVGGGGSGGAGVATLRAIGFPLGAGNLPDGAPRSFLGSPISVNYTDPMAWRKLGRMTFPAGGGYWVGAIVGGSSNSCRIARTLVEGNFPDGYGGDRYVDAGVSYASPPTTCPATGVGTSRASIYVLTQPGGGRLGGVLVAKLNLPAASHYLTGYTLNSAGTNGLLDATPYPISLTEGEVTPADLRIAGVGRLSFTASVVRTGDPEGPVVLIPEPTGRPEMKPRAYETVNGVPVRRVEWDEDTNSWIYP